MFTVALSHAVLNSFQYGFHDAGKTGKSELLSFIYYIVIYFILQKKEGKLVETVEFSSSLPSSSQYSSSSVQSKDTIHTQVSRNTLEPPSPCLHRSAPLPPRPVSFPTNCLLLQSLGHLATVQLSGREPVAGQQGGKRSALPSARPARQSPPLGRLILIPPQLLHPLRPAQVSAESVRQKSLKN